MWERLFYIMDDDFNITTVPTFEAWCDSGELNHHSIEWTGNDALHVSTIFIGLDQNHAARLGFAEDTRPYLFETLVRGGEYDQSQERYATLDEARAGHKRWCSLVFKYEGASNGK